MISWATRAVRGSMGSSSSPGVLWLAASLAASRYTAATSILKMFVVGFQDDILKQLVDETGVKEAHLDAEGFLESGSQSLRHTSET